MERRGERRTAGEADAATFTNNAHRLMSISLTPLGGILGRLGFSGPRIPLDEFWSMSMEEQDTARRGQVLAYLLFGILLFVVPTTLFFAVWALTAPAAATQEALGAQAAAGLFVSLALFLLAWLNRNGFVETACALSCLLFMGAVGLALVSADANVGGYGWIDQLGWVIMSFGVMFASNIMRPRFSVLILLVYMVMIWVYVVMAHVEPGTLDYPPLVGLIPPGASYQQLVRVFEVVTLSRLFLFAFGVWILGVLQYASVMAKLRLGDASQHMALEQIAAREATEVTLQMTEREMALRVAFLHWHTMEITKLLTAINKKQRDYQLSPLPAQYAQYVRDQTFHTEYKLLQLLAQRLPSLMVTASAATVSLEHVTRMEHVLAQYRQLKYASPSAALFSQGELAAVTHVNTGLFELDATLSTMGLYLQKREQEDEWVKRAIYDVLIRYFKGEHQARVPESAYYLRLGDLAHRVNDLLGSLPDSTPFARSSSFTEQDTSSTLPRNGS